MTRPFISADDMTYDERARALVRIGQDAITVENDAALDADFASNFAFHGPGAEMNLDGLKAFFAAMRHSFTGFSCERREIISEGAFLAARTTMSGVFENRFELSPSGPVEPNGALMTLELINLFRYDDDGRLAEEWVQYDNLDFLRQLGVDLVPARTAKFLGCVAKSY